MSILNVQDFPTDPTQAITPFTGDSGSGGAKGAVPAPPAGSAAAGDFLRADGTWALPPTGSGTVTSVGLAAPAEFTVSGSPVSSSGTLTLAKANEAANTVWAGPTSGVAAVPAFRGLASSDLPTSPVFSGNPQAPVMWIPYTLAANLVAPTDGRAHIPGELSIPSGLLVDLSATTGHTLLEVW